MTDPKTFPLSNGDDGSPEPFDEQTGGWGPLPTLSPIEVLSPATEAKLAAFDDLLAACKNIVETYCFTGPLYQMILDAIAEAEGGAK